MQKTSDQGSSNHRLVGHNLLIFVGLQAACRV